MSAIHWRDEMFFERLEDASVRIKGKDSSGVEWAVTIPPNEWASIIHHVRWQPVDHAKWSMVDEAESFHSGVRHA